MSIVYLAKRKSGKWTTVPKGQATMPPFESLDGPYDYRVAQFIMAERNKTWGNKPRNGKQAHDTWLT